jgi:hypothetical protein
MELIPARPVTVGTDPGEIGHGLCIIDPDKTRVMPYAPCYS